jgi:hypothetical protein
MKFTECAVQLNGALMRKNRSACDLTLSSCKLAFVNRNTACMCSQTTADPKSPRQQHCSYL